MSSRAAASAAAGTSRPSTSRPASSTANTATVRRTCASFIHWRSASTPPWRSVAAARSVAMREGGPMTRSGGGASRPRCWIHTAVPAPTAATTSAIQKPMKIFQKSRPTLFLHQVVAEAAHGADQLAAIAELLADAREVHVDRAVEARQRPAERLLGDLVLADHAAGVAHQHFEHVELDARQVDLAAAPQRSSLLGPERERADFQRPAVRRRLRPAQDRAQARDQLARRAGLRHVVVGAELEPDDAVDVVAARGEHDHRHAARLADQAQRLDAVDLRHHHVEHHDLVAAREREARRRLAVVHGGDAEAFALEIFPEHAGELDVVVGQQDLRAHASDDSRAPPGGWFLYSALPWLNRALGRPP